MKHGGCVSIFNKGTEQYAAKLPGSMGFDIRCPLNTKTTTMSHWEQKGKSDEWYTPKYVFDALECEFDMDVAASYYPLYSNVPAKKYIDSDSLSKQWDGFVWVNPLFGGRNGIIPWLDRFFDHGNGIALTPDRTSTEWWQVAAKKADAILFVSGKIKFIKPDGSTGDQPSNGTTLFSAGKLGTTALWKAYRNGLGVLLNKPYN